MQKVGGVVQSKGGRVVVGAVVRVFLAGTVTPATIFSDAQGQISVKDGDLKSDNEGEYSFYVANGRYDIKTYVQGRLDGQYLDQLVFDPGALFLGNNSLVPSPSWDDVPRSDDDPAFNRQSQALLNRFDFLDSDMGSTRVGFMQVGDGAVALNVQDELRSQVRPQQFGAIGDGLSDDTLAMQRIKSKVDAVPTAVVNFSGGRHKTTGGFWPNNVSPTLMYFDKPSVLGIFDGTSSNPNSVDNDPALFVQKYTSYDSGTDSYAHNVGGVFGSVIIKGSGSTTNDTDGTWIGVLGNAVMQGVNQGTDLAPNYDAAGNVIGTAGFARLNNPPGDGKIACGVWGYPEGPVLNQAQLDALPNDNWSLCALEGNIQQNHPDIGERTGLNGKGSTVGIFLNNYRTPNTGMCNWSFGIVIQGNRVDPNGSSTAPDNFNGIYTGILLNNIKAKGIRFGQNFKAGSYGLWFPDTYPGDRMAAAMYVGDNVINWAQYTGATFNNGDMWANAGTLYYRKLGVNRTVVLNGDGAINQTATALGVGTAPVFNLDVTAESGGASGAITGYGGGGTLLLRGASGTKTVPAASTLNMVLGFIGGRGHTGADFDGGTMASIGLYAAENWTTTAKGTYITFGTAPIGGAGRVERFRIDPSGNLLCQTVGSGLRVKEGSNAKQGVATLVGGAVTVSNTSVTANSRIFITSQADGGTPGWQRVSARVAGTSFTITSSSASDTSTVAYQIFEPA